jgi:acetylornithine deacetylase/succinyl-diaminopimelate desuccinylase-like protein
MGAGCQNGSIASDDLSLVCKVQAGKGNVFALDVLPDIQFCPVADGKDTHVFTRSFQPVVKVPQLRALVLGIPLAEPVAKTEKALFGPRLFLVATGAPQCTVKFEFSQCVQKCDGLRGIATRVRSCFLCNLSLVNRILYPPHNKIRINLLHPVIAVGDRLIKIMSRIDVHQREWYASRVECLHRQKAHHDRILAAGKKHDRSFKLRRYLAQHIDGLGFQDVKGITPIGSHDGVPFCLLLSSVINRLGCAPYGVDTPSPILKFTNSVKFAASLQASNVTLRIDGFQDTFKNNRLLGVSSLGWRFNNREYSVNLNRLESAFEARKNQIIEDWESFLKFPSVSADPVHHKDCLACADWVGERLRRQGFAVTVAETETKPFVFAERPGRPDRPTVLFYGHYDVQPADPVHAWTTAPFEPVWRDGRLYARGAQDNKGQVFYTLAAIETLIADDVLDVNLKILIEGEEECSSVGLNQSLEKWRERLQADILMVHDTCMVQSGAPTIIMGLRGIIYLNAQLSGPDHDLHSGVHGGLAPNAAQGVAQLAASLFDADGRIAVPGFYDGVIPPSERESQLAAAVPFDVAAYRQQTGTNPDGGMRNLPTYERVGFLPSLDVNGIHSGYGGSGMKTIIPASAELKLTARLVPGQDPEAVLDALSAHLFRSAPAGMRLTLSDSGIGGPGFRLDPDAAAVRTAHQALRKVCPDQPVAFLWEGASIPIVARLAEVSGATPLLVGFGLEADRIHATDESFSLLQFKSGFLYTAILLQLVGG